MSTKSTKALKIPAAVAEPAIRQILGYRSANAELLAQNVNAIENLAFRYDAHSGRRSSRASNKGNRAGES